MCDALVPFGFGGGLGILFTERNNENGNRGNELGV